jgi:phasin family protein
MAKRGKSKPIASKPDTVPSLATSMIRKPAKAVSEAAARSVAAKIAHAPVPIDEPVQATAKPATVAPAKVPRAKPVAPVFAHPVTPVYADPTSPAAAKPSFFKETFAMTTPTFDFAAAFKTAFSDAQEKAKAAYEKSTVAMGDANEFAKGNVEALVESTKIMASGLQELTTELVAESREAFENLTAEVKTIAAVKSPADFFKLQSELMRKQMDVLMANGTKHSEAFLKLASDAAAPLSSRVSMAVEKVKTAA